MNKLAGLVQGGRETFSMGRVAFWLIFALSFWYWLAWPDRAFPGSLEFALGAVMAYNLGGKAVNNFSRRPRRMDCDDSDQD